MNSHRDTEAQRTSGQEAIRFPSESPSLCGPNDFLLWQLADSAFPTGGFAHSAGLEAAWQHGEVRNRTELLTFLETNLQQLGRAALPFVNTAYDEPGRLAQLDQLSDAFLSNHVANRASRLQGRAFLTAVERIFPAARAAPPLVPDGAGGPADRAPFAHLAPTFGACLRELDVPRPTVIRLFFFSHLRSLLAASVRLNIVGPMEAQVLQHRLATLTETVAVRASVFTLTDLAQTAPLLDLWQGAQDRLYSRLFQT